MSRQNFTKDQKIQLLHECAEWRSVQRKSFDEFIIKYEVSKTSLYEWSKAFNIDIHKRSRSELSSQESSIQTSFVKVEDTNKFQNQHQKSTNSKFINIKTQYCNIEVPESLSKESFKILLESLKEIN